QEPTTDRIDLVVDRIVHAVELPAERQEAERGQSLGIVAGELVSGELLTNELVIRQVVVHRLNDVVAVSIREREPPLLLECVAFGVCIASDVEPMPAPALTI